MIVYMDRMRRAQNDDDQKDMNDRGAQEFVRVHGIQVNNHWHNIDFSLLKYPCRIGHKRNV